MTPFPLCSIARLDPRKNHLLASLPEADLHRLLPHLESVALGAGQVLCESGSMPLHAYFPISAVVSLLYLTEEGNSAEVAVVGNDGVVGISLFMGGGTSPSRAVVQSSGQGYRVGALAVQEAVRTTGPLLILLLRYTQALIAQMVQTAACNRHHSIDQQLCRRLLMGLDLGRSDELQMTQELAANLLGVRREGVTAAAMKLQRAGVISYSRGHIAVLDRGRLELLACECYAAARREYERLMHWPLVV